MDIFGLGWKFIQNVDKVDRLSELARPMIDKAAEAQGLTASVRDAYDANKRAYDLAKPVIEEFNKVSDELVPLFLELLRVFTPAVVTATLPTPDAPATVEQAVEKMNYNVKWIQETLMKDLGKKALSRFGADGTYGEETRNAVEKFQQKHAECGEADGWVGPRTAAVMEALNPPWGKTV